MDNSSSGKSRRRMSPSGAGRHPESLSKPPCPGRASTDEHSGLEHHSEARRDGRYCQALVGRRYRTCQFFIWRFALTCHFNELYPQRPARARLLRSCRQDHYLDLLAQTCSTIRRTVPSSVRPELELAHLFFRNSADVEFGCRGSPTQGGGSTPPIQILLYTQDSYEIRLVPIFPSR